MFLKSENYDTSRNLGTYNIKLVAINKYKHVKAH